MSFLSQTFQAGSSNNTGSVISVVNSTTLPLPDPTGSASFTGGWISAEKFAVLQCALISNTTVSLFLEQSFEPIGNAEILPIIYEYTQLNTLQTVYHYVTLPWVKIDIVNTQAGNELFYLSTKLSLTPPPPSSSTQPISGTVSVDNFPAIQDVSGSVAVSNFPAIQDISGSVAITNFPAQQTVYGENSNYEFYATPATNVPAVYADGAQGTDVTGGWKYTNSGSTKINWYCYASSTSATDYKVSQLNSMYAVINQQSTLGLAQAQNPFIIFYTRPDSTSTTWYKNKFFFGENSHTDILGIKLLYTGTDPVGIHPEITGINRIQLGFKPLLSTSTIALSQNENVWLGSLQTTSAPAGQFDFTFQEFGVDWVKTPAILPIEFGAVQAQITNFPTTQPISGTVGLNASLNTATYNQAVTALSFQGTTYDMSNNSLVDVLLLATGTIVSGAVRLDYSIDDINWFPNNSTTYTISGADPHMTIIGLKTGSRYIRVSTGITSTFRADNLKMVFSSKRD